MEVRRRSQLSSREFSVYKAQSMPVLMHGLMEAWPTVKLWTDEYLIAACGKEPVEVMAWREHDPQYEINCEQHRSNMRFSDYINTVSKGASNDFYITANNHFFARPGTRKLLQDLGTLPYLAGPSSGDNTHLWFGSAGTVTPLHYDVIDIILAQIRGRKMVTMISPEHTDMLYNSIGVFSDVDCLEPDLKRHPLYKKAGKRIVFLDPWEALFIPRGWWHHVLALDTSISVSFTNLI